MRFDPEEWSTIYDAPRPSGQAFVFRHGVELAGDACVAGSKPGESWVDVGCGTGDLAARLADAGLLVTALDADPAMVRAAQERHGSNHRKGELRFAVADAERLPFADTTLDGVVATAVVGLLGELGPFLAEVQRVLRPGGTVVLTFTNRPSVLHSIGRRLCTLRREWSSPRYAAAARRYTLPEAVAELRQTGLRVAQTRYYNFFLSPGERMWPPPKPALHLERALQGRIGASLSRNFLAVAVKETGTPR